ncbi:hypothetical protein F5883DRAFT_539095 [Diaporthe sp. PMI_573]|nr:hypothetical protein F5883DRAFT_539095 [Diaporthaceae sp. PMI_573]
MSQWFDMWSTESPDERPEIQLPGLRASVSSVVGVRRKDELVECVGTRNDGLLEEVLHEPVRR